MSEPGPQSEIDSRTERVRRAVKGWTRHLVDLGGRNTLLWYRDLPSGTLDLTTAHPGGVAMLLAGRPTRLSDLVREPAAFDQARRRARTIAGKARELREERGIDTGFVAVGMATWSLGRSGAAAGREPAAPVLLRSCTLRPTTPQHDDYELDLGDEIELNPVLEHYLASEQGITLDADRLEALAHTPGGFDPYPAFEALTETCSSVPDFEVAPRLVLGTFSYAKLPMVADLAAQGDALADHDVIAAIAGDPTAMRSVRHELPSRAPDVVPDPASGLLILDADSSQQEAIDAARSGAHLVIHGPPGTGKSQTIANLVAALAADGKRILFVAEKRAAIDAVVGRLDRVGLGDLVLDLHDGARGRRRIATELAEALPGRSAKPA
ncbi:AAA domain-containing protein, partial [Knoellia flava]